MTNHVSSEAPGLEFVLPDDRLDRLADRMEEGVREAVRRSMAECLTVTLREEMALALERFLGRERAGREPEGAAGDPERDAVVTSILDDACFKLEQILQSMERATLEVMDLVERRLDVHDDMIALLGRGHEPGARDALRAMFDGLHSDLMDVITSLSFQDLTGQRIKRVMGSLGQAAELVKGQPAAPGRAPAGAQSAPESPAATAQDAVDALLSQFGM